jgi:hypothetical protein
MAKILARVTQVGPDRTSYKQYSPKLDFNDLWVELEVEDSEIRKEKPFEKEGIDTEYNVLTLGGFTALLDTVATAIDKMHTGYQKKVQKGDY